jgi:hypothetical protein
MLVLSTIVVLSVHSGVFLVVAIRSVVVFVVGSGHGSMTW